MPNAPESSIHHIASHGDLRVAVSEYQVGAPYRLGKILEITAPHPSGATRVIQRIRFQDRPATPQDRDGVSERCLLSVLEHRVECHMDGGVLAKAHREILDAIHDLGKMLDARDAADPRIGGAQ